MKEEPAKGPKNDVRKAELTRREWMLRLGEAAVLFGFSGSLPEVEAKAASALSLLDPQRAGLPPGLFEASSEHMAHALISDERFLKIPAGSETDYVRPREGPYEPHFFSTEEFKMVTRLVELILGETSEGASDGQKRVAQGGATFAEVAEWIDQVVSNAAAVREAARRLAPDHKALAVRYYGAEAVEKLETADPQETCREGLEWLERESQKLHAGTFLSLEESQQVQMLDAISDARSDLPRESPGTHLFAFLKRETIRGFYTSRFGLKELDFKGNAFYVECPGCSAKGKF